MDRKHRKKDTDTKKKREKKRKKEIDDVIYLCCSRCPLLEDPGSGDQRTIGCRWSLHWLFLLKRTLLLQCLRALKLLHGKERTASGSGLRNGRIGVEDGATLSDLVGINVLIVDEDVHQLPGAVAALGVVVVAHVMTSVGRLAQQRGPVVRAACRAHLILG